MILIGATLSYTDFHTSHLIILILDANAPPHTVLVTSFLSPRSGSETMCKGANNSKILIFNIPSTPNFINVN